MASSPLAERVQPVAVGDPPAAAAVSQSWNATITQATLLPDKQEGHKRRFSFVHVKRLHLFMCCFVVFPDRIGLLGYPHTSESPELGCPGVQ